MLSWTLASSPGFSRELGKSLLQILVFTKEIGLKRCLLPEDEEVVATDLGRDHTGAVKIKQGERKEN